MDQLVFGCGSLMGRLGRRQSRALVEAALAAGIRRFDVARPYGYGEAEQVVGTVSRDVAGVTVATKVGFGPLAPETPKRLVRAGARAVLPVVQKLRGGGAPAVDHSAERVELTRSGPAPDLSPARIEASVALSLKEMRRSALDTVFLHEPQGAQLSDEAAETMLRLAKDGTVARWGVAGLRADTLTQYAARPDLFAAVQVPGGPLAPPVAVTGADLTVYSVFGPKAAHLRAFGRWLSAQGKLDEWLATGAADPGDGRDFGHDILRLAVSGGTSVVVSSQSPDGIGRLAAAVARPLPDAQRDGMAAVLTQWNAGATR